MKKKRNIKISNRLSYTLIALGIIVLLGISVYAVAGVSHSLDEIPSIPWSKLIGVPADFADGVDNNSICPEGYILEENNFRSQCVKDFSEISCEAVHTDFFEYIANYYIRRVDGEIQTRATFSGYYNNIQCDSGWVSDITAQCRWRVNSDYPYYYAKAEFDGYFLRGTLTSDGDELANCKLAL